MWGNPFPITATRSREQAVAEYEEYLLANETLMANIWRLKGKRLGCYCAPALCHGEVLARYADQAEEPVR